MGRPPKEPVRALTAAERDGTVVPVHAPLATPKKT